MKKPINNVIDKIMNLMIDKNRMSVNPLYKKEINGYAIVSKKSNNIARWSPLDNCFLIFSTEDMAETFLRKEEYRDDYIIKEIKII